MEVMVQLVQQVLQDQLEHQDLLVLQVPVRLAQPAPREATEQVEATEPMVLMEHRDQLARLEQKEIRVQKEIQEMLDLLGQRDLVLQLWVYLLSRQ